MRRIGDWRHAGPSPAGECSANGIGAVRRLRWRVDGADRGTRRRRVLSYACSAYHERGSSVCANNVHLPVDTVDQAVLGTLRDLLTADVVDDVIEALRGRHERPQRGDAERERLTRALVAAEVQVERYAEVIGLVGNVAAAARRLQDAESHRQAIAAQLAALGDAPVRPCIAWPLVERQARERLAHWQDLLGRRSAEVRPLLRELLHAPMQFTPVVDDASRGYRFVGDAVIAGLLSGVVNVPWRMASPPGFEPGFQP